MMPLIKFFIFSSSILYIFDTLCMTWFLPEWALFLSRRSDEDSKSIPRWDLKSNFESRYLSMLSRLAIGYEMTIDFSRSFEFLRTSGWKGSIDYSLLKYFIFLFYLFFSFSSFSSFLSFLLRRSSSLIYSSIFPFWGFILNSYLISLDFILKSSLTRVWKGKFKILPSFFFFNIFSLSNSFLSPS